MSNAEYFRAYYHTKTDKRHKLDLQLARKRKHRKMLDEYMATQSCVDCGNADVRVLELDHVRGEKEINVSDAVRRGWSWIRIEKEIEKCEVRCANCHRIRHYKR